MICLTAVSLESCCWPLSGKYLHVFFSASPAATLPEPLGGRVPFQYSRKRRDYAEVQPEKWCMPSQAPRIPSGPSAEPSKMVLLLLTHSWAALFPSSATMMTTSDYDRQMALTSTTTTSSTAIPPPSGIAAAGNKHEHNIKKSRTTRR